MLPFHALPFHALPTHALPTHVLRLISEYSKPMTRPDWRTFNRNISMDTFIKDKDNLSLCKKTHLLYRLVHMNMYDYLYIMTNDELINLLINQECKTNYYHEREQLYIRTKHGLVLTLISQEKDIKQKQNEDIMKKRKQDEKRKIVRLKKIKKLRIARKQYIIFKYINL